MLHDRPYEDHSFKEPQHLETAPCRKPACVWVKIINASITRSFDGWPNTGRLRVDVTLFVRQHCFLSSKCPWVSSLPAQHHPSFTLFVRLKDDFLCFHIVEQFISVQRLTHWYNLVCHKARNAGQFLAVSAEVMHLLEQMLLLLQLL